VKLPVTPPFAPMEASLVSEIPEGAGWQYEPKWDGFRCLIFRDHDDVFLQSKAGQPLARYFPELVDSVRKLNAQRFVLDGEIAVPVNSRLSFDDLLQRVHPAASRVQKLSREHPAMFIVFDLIVDAEGKTLTDRTFLERRKTLEEFAASYLGDNRSIRLSPATTEISQARRWFKAAGGDLDGIIAKRLDSPYCSGERSAMEKVKPLRTADCVVGGFRYATKSEVIGSLLLGLYDDAGLLHHVGFCSGLKTAERKELTPKLRALIRPPGFTGRAPGGPSRWSTERSAEWQPLDPKLVVEVSYDHLTGGRFRHGTKLIRWRPDKAPTQCRMDQVAPTGKGSLALL
jgi:ATP-dependent DNA ligase